MMTRSTTIATRICPCNQRRDIFHFSELLGIFSRMMGRRQAKQARYLWTAFSTFIGHTGILMAGFLILKNFSDTLYEPYKPLMMFGEKDVTNSTKELSGMETNQSEQSTTSRALS
jgi:hypothetical protein